MGDSVVWFSGQFGFCVDIPVTVAVEAGWWEVGRPLAERADPACTLKWPGGLLMFRFSQMILLLLLCSEVGCQGAKFWKKSDTTSRQSQVAVEQDKPESKKDSEKSRFSFAKFTNRKSAAADESSDEAEPLIDQQMDMLLQQGQQALEQNDLAGAQQAYREILLSEPTNAAANHGLAMAADLERRWKDAEYHYLQALKASPNDANILSDLGYSCLLQRREAEAARYLNQALAIDAKHENARVNLALLDLQQGRAEAAEQRLREIGSRRPLVHLAQGRIGRNKLGDSVDLEALLNCQGPSLDQFARARSGDGRAKDMAFRRRHHLHEAMNLALGLCAIVLVKWQIGRAHV